MKKSFRIVTALVLILSMFALNVGAMTVGTAAEAADVGANAVCVLQTNLETPINATGFNYLHAWVYFSNAAVISSTRGNSQIEITSSGTCDQNELSWNMKDRTYTDGWNEFYLPMSEAGVEGGDCDLSAVNFVRFYTFAVEETDATTEVKFGNIEFVNEIPLEASYNVDMTGATSTTVNGADYICEATASDIVIFQKNFETPFDVSEYATSFVRLNIYVTNAAAISDNAQAEFTSGGNCDVEETSFRYPKLVDGWNTVYFKVSEAAESAAKLDAINFVRFYFILTEETTIKITDVAFGTATEFGKEADYTIVDKAIESANAKLALAKNRNINYTYTSLKALNDAIAAVETGLFDDAQDKVDAYAKAIDTAAANLKQGVSPWLYYLTLDAIASGKASINFDFASFVPFLNYVQPKL